MKWLWPALALFYLILALVTYMTSRPIKKNLAALAQEGPDSMLVSKKGKEISLNQGLYQAYLGIIMTDIAGFILAAIAALISA